MSDNAVEPGAPTRVPEPSKGGVSNEVDLPPKVRSYASEADRTILRLNKLLATPGGLASFLGTLNYTLYFIAYIQSKSPELKARLYTLLNKPAPPIIAAPGTSVAALAKLLSSTRTTLRLFGLLPMYAWARQLLQGPKPGQDSVLYAVAVAQCSFYTMFQLLENIALLQDNAVLSQSLTARWNKSGSTAKIYLWSYRAWLFGVVCDFLRLGREAQLSSQKRSERSSSQSFGQDVKDLAQSVKEEDSKWWSDLVVPVSWLPVALHSGSETGLPGMNLGIMGVCGAMAYLGRARGLWEQTKDV